MPIDPLQAEVTRIALAAAGHEFALAGGNALIVHGVVSRATADIDLFSPLAGGAGQVAAAVREALTDAGFTVELVAGLTEGNDDFGRFQITRGDDAVLLDLARDWRAHPPVVLPVGPVLALEDAVAAKAAAMVGRGLPRDYIDIAAAMAYFDRTRLMQLAFSCDPGLRMEDFAHAAQRLDQLADDQFAHYGLPPDQVAELRAEFAAWPRSADNDLAARAAYQVAHAEHPPPVPDRAAPVDGPARRSPGLRPDRRQPPRRTRHDPGRGHER